LSCGNCDEGSVCSGVVRMSVAERLPIGTVVLAGLVTKVDGKDGDHVSPGIAVVRVSGIGVVIVSVGPGTTVD